MTDRFSIPRRYGRGVVTPFMTANGSLDLPTADGNIDLVVKDFVRTHQVFVQFRNAGGALVTPTGGTVAVRGEFLEGTFLEANPAVIAATEVEAGNASYTVPQINGPVSRIRLTLSGIAGAAVMRATHWGY